MSGFFLRRNIDVNFNQADVTYTLSVCATTTDKVWWYPTGEDPYTKLLGVDMDQHLTYGDQLNNLLSSCYGSVTVLRWLKNLALFQLKKTLAESLVLAKIDYACIVFYTVRLERLQNASAGFVLQKFAKTNDLKYLNWLPIIGRMVSNLKKLTHKALTNKKFSEYISFSTRSVNA